MELESLRSQIAQRFGIRIDAGTRTRTKAVESFKRSLACEVLSRRGLSQKQIAKVMNLSPSGVEYSLKVVRSRLPSKFFARYVEDLSVPVEQYYLDMVMACCFRCQSPVR